MIKKIVIALILILISAKAFLQEVATPNQLEPSLGVKSIVLDTPVVGKLCPDFSLKQVLYYKTNMVRLSDFKGKWLILDFWTKYCTACIASFPHTDEMQKKFKDKVQFLLIGNGKKDELTSIFNKVKKRNNLQLPLAIDTILSKRFGVYGVPHIIWIDDRGIVRAVTSGRYLKDEHLEAFLSGKNVNLPVKLSSWIYNQAKNTIENNNKNDNNNNKLFESVLMPYKIGLRGTVSRVLPGTSSLSVVNGSLKTLYSVAYQNYRRDESHLPYLTNRMVFEVQDASRFEYRSENIYCYRLIIPRNRSSELLSIMQQELNWLFPYTATIEKRKTKVLSLVCFDSSRLSTIGGRPLEKWGSTGISITNKTVADLIGMLQYYLQKEIIVDETFYSGNLDVRLDAIMVDKEDVNNALFKHGLKLIEKEKDVEFLVIRDKLN